MKLDERSNNHFLQLTGDRTMTIASVQAFLGQVTQDQELQEAVATAMQSENDREAVTLLAQSKGYDFTANELWQEIQNRQNQIQHQHQQDNGELSESELEAIAGGELLVMTAMGAVSTGVVGGMAGYLVGSAKKIKW
jgi:predicted ribosomally synthesized peptide with nif11-like leader